MKKHISPVWACDGRCIVGAIENEQGRRFVAFGESEENANVLFTTTEAAKEVAFAILEIAFAIEAEENENERF